ncbi:protein TIC 62, chloroplastic isoform X1 [Nicotiana tomentosiformis]|uniref:protein TIC 62, chloroplastic isoform X1 n=1 Tax=Nicotiana tomentosiformis TaxID=4098 RepID=UPI00051C76BD|nr:protein TIC 62, chloroplastic isoform X1 [Nicotiana tomentosiformis]
MSAMELRCLQSLITSNIPRNGLAEKPFLCGQPLTLIQTSSKRYNPNSNNFKCLRFRAQTSAKVSSLEPAKDVKSKDGNLVFVAGATGKVGSRTVRELLKLGFKVRAGVRSAQRAQPLVKSVEQMKLENAADGGAKAIEKLEIVECDLEKIDRIRPALGNASIVICCIGASEKEIFDVTGPYRIDYQATKNLIDAATAAKVDHFILLTSLGTNKVGFPAAILNLFWGVLVWKRKAEEALLASGLPYTIVRPGGMERPTDSYKETHNITLSEEDTLFGGQVSNLQVAELMAVMAKNRSLSYCKVVEVIAETTAPLTPMEDLLAKIPPQRVEVSPTKETGDLQKPAASSSITSEIPSTSLEKEPAETKLKAAAPLSPYAVYEDLKPPTSPTPTPSVGTGSTKESKAMSTVVANDSPSSSSEINSSESSIPDTDSTTQRTDKKKTTPSSPYIFYEDLKPPTSPTPNPPGGRLVSARGAEDGKPDTVASVVVDGTSDKAELLTARPLSPYTAYEDLKPPISPSPTPSGPKASISTETAPQLAGGNEISASITTISTEKDPSHTVASCHSPYPFYDDLKPPTSPTPTPSGTKASPTVEVTSPLTGGNDVVISSAINSACGDPSTSLASSRSPYPMYEDLKPPTSPTPSFKKM